VIRCLEQQGVAYHFSSYRGTTSFWDKPMSSHAIPRMPAFHLLQTTVRFRLRGLSRRGLWWGHPGSNTWLVAQMSPPIFQQSLGRLAMPIPIYTCELSDLGSKSDRLAACWEYWSPKKKNEKYMTIQYGIPVRKDLSYLWFFLRDLHAKQNFLLPLPPLLHLPCRGHPWWDGCQMGDGSMLAGAML
jgi:hypothetical protein